VRRLNRLPVNTGEREIVEAGYDAVADRYSALEQRGTEWPRMRWLRKVLDRVPAGGRVLDIGCGNGLPATRAIAEGHRATGIDVSRGQIDRARRNVPHADFLHGDFSEMEVEPGFDAIVAFYVIEHLPRERHAELFRRLAAWLRPGGFLLFTIEPDDEPGVVGEWLGEPMFFSQYDAETTLGLVAEAGFEPVETARETQLEGDREVEYLWVLARRASS
jgi:SAM-dependent methyltransferase